MNVTSPELSKELYRLSGWKETDFTWYKKFDEANWTLGYAMRGRTVSAWLPAYSLGELVRKLQDNDQTITMRWNKDMGGRAGMSAWDNMWCIGTFNMPQGEYPVEKTPEDAAAQLCIDLLKSGILRKEE